jgi:hypothetical protein
LAANDWKDSGWKSRKLWFSIFAIGILYRGAVVAMDEASFRAVYESFVGGVVGIAGLFLVGNIGAKFVSTKAPVATTPVPKPVKVPQQPVEQIEQSPEEQSPQ